MFVSKDLTGPISAEFEKIGNDYVYTDELNAEQYAEMEKTHKNAMRVVFKDGKMHNRETFSTIRARLASEE